MFDTVNDRSVLITENDIAVFPHDLHDQLFFTEISKLVEMFDFKMDDPFQFWLPDFRNAPVVDMFAKQHTEIRGSHWTWFVSLCQID